MIKNSELKKESFRLGEIAEMVGMSHQTLYNYALKERFPTFQSAGGHNYVLKKDLIIFLESLGLYLNDTNEDKFDVVYARVSSQDQKNTGDLDRQVLDIIRGVKDLNNPEIITDVASGLNDNRVGLNKIFNLVDAEKVSRIIVSNPDRLTRFGYRYIERYFQSHGVTIICLNETENKTNQQELVDDMMDLIASFSGRFYGLRSAKKHKARKVLDEIGEEDV